MGAVLVLVIVIQVKKVSENLVFLVLEQGLYRFIAVQELNIPLLSFIDYAHLHFVELS